jgi:alanine dehydrogenase
MSEVAGRLAPLVGAHCLMRPEGGRGVLIGGVSGVEPARVVVLGAGVVIGAVLVPGAKAPKLVSNALVSRMKPGSVLVDIAIDQGGCFEDSRPTTHAEPTFRVHNSVFYCVANMPGAVPYTSTYALTNVTMPYVVDLAEKGFEGAVRDNAALRAGVSTVGGRLTCPAVAAANGLASVPTSEALNLG